MRRLTRILGGLLLLGCASTTAHATQPRAWVSGHGTDAAGCGSVGSPCRSLQYAHDDIVSPGGEIDILDPAGYGALSVTKAITIVNDGVGTAGVQTTSGAAITVTAGPDDSVILRGLTIEGLGTGTTGVQFNSGRSLGIDASFINGFTGYGVNAAPNNGSGVSATLAIAHSNVSDNSTGGVLLLPGGGTQMKATLDDTTVAGNTNGITSDGSGDSAGNVHTIISNCVIRNFTGEAIVANAQSTDGVVHVMIDHTVIGHLDNTAVALTANGANASIAINLSSVSNVGTVAATTNGGTVNSFANNGITFYGTLGPLGSTPQK